MAKDTEVKVGVKVTDDGTLKETDKKARNAGKGMENMGKNTHSADRAMKGLSAQSSNTTKNFSKMSQGLTGGLVPAYAVLATNIFAVSAAFRFLEQAANYRMLIQGQQEWATITGESLSLITSRLQEATGQQLAFGEAAQSAAIARAAGVSTDQIERLGMVAKNASIALGRDLTDSVNRLIRGTTKAEPELLDELGIILRLETASKNYAAAIGKTAKELTIFEKTQAVTNEVLRQGEEKFGSFETKLNSFTKLAKSFDDLLNKIKRSLSGVAELMAGAMSNNVAALAGGFALLGSSIFRSLTPDAPTYDSQAVIGKAQGDIGKMYKGSMKPGEDGRFSSKQLTKMKRYAAREKSTVFDVENFTRQERMRTVEILRLQDRKLEIERATGLKKWRLASKLNNELMIKDHGEFVGRMKIMQGGLMKFMSFLGWAGLAVTAFGIVKQAVYEYTTDEETKRFHEMQDRLVEKFEKQATELNKLNNSMVRHKNIMGEINQLGKFFGNMSFSGLDSGFGEIGQVRAENRWFPKIQDFFGGAWEGYERGKGRNYGGGSGKYVMEGSSEGPEMVTGFTEKQRSVVSDVVSILKNAQSKLAGKPLEDITAQITILEEALRADKITDPDKIKNILVELATGGNASINKLATLGNVIQGTNDAILTHTNAMGALTIANTEFSKMTNTYRDLGAAYTDIATKLTDVNDAALRSDKIFSEANESWFSTMLGAEEFERISNIADPKEKIAELGKAMSAEGKRLHDKEVGYLTEATNLETERLETTRRMPKLLASQVNKQYKVTQLANEIARIEDYKLELAGQGVKQNDVAMKQEEAKVNKLKAQLAIAEDQASLFTEMKDNVLNAFASGLTAMIDGLIQGTMTLKEGFASMAKMVLQAISQILAKMAALKILSFMFPGTDFAAFLAGGGYMQGKGQRRVPGYERGGIVSEPTYMVGEGRYNEAVVPLPDGRSIPVQMKGGSGSANVTVNISSDGQTTSNLTSNGGEQAAQLAKGISAVVQEELHKQQRNGGILSPYGNPAGGG